MVKKDRSTYVNKTYLMIMLPELYQNHFNGNLSLAEYLLLELLINLLQSIKKVSLETLATALPQQFYLRVEERKFKDFYLCQV
jgi:hypothetical protein